VESSGLSRRSWPVVAGRATVPDVPADTWRVRVESADGRAWQGQVTSFGEALEIRIE
jgi:hypothetical protein